MERSWMFEDFQWRKTRLEVSQKEVTLDDCCCKSSIGSHLENKISLQIHVEGPHHVNQSERRGFDLKQECPDL